MTRNKAFIHYCAAKALAWRGHACNISWRLKMRLSNAGLWLFSKTLEVTSKL